MCSWVWPGALAPQWAINTGQGILGKENAACLQTRGNRGPASLGLTRSRLV